MIGVLSPVAKAGVIFDALAITNAGEQSNLGQSFTTPGLGSENKLSTVVLKSATTSPTAVAANYTASLSVFLDSNNNPSDWNPSGAALATSDSKLVNPAVDGAGTLYTFSFASLPTLSDNTVYLMEIVRSGGGTTRLAFGADPGGTGTSGGQAFIGVSGSGGTLLNGNDFGLEIVTVPEPAFLPWAGLVIGLAAVSRRLSQR